jgi:hypothetical protein
MIERGRRRQEHQQQQQQEQQLVLLLTKKNRRRRNLRSSTSSFIMALLFLAVSLLLSSSSSSSSIVVQAEDTTSYDYSDLSGHLKLMRHCDVNIVYVNSIYLTCDSPGSYYYGSGGYRKSSRCKYGDKADMYIFCKYLYMFVMR